MKMLKKKDGFTLVELIVVIAILAILAGVAIPAYSGYIKKANETADITALSAVKTAVTATYATEGTVTKIEVTDKDATGTGVVANQVLVWLNGDETKTGNDAVDGKVANTVDDFKTYYNVTTFSIDLKAGTTATWTSASSEWDIQ